MGHAVSVGVDGTRCLVLEVSRKPSHLILILVPFLCKPLSAHLIQTTHCVHAGGVLVLDVRTQREREVRQKETKRKKRKMEEKKTLHELYL